MDEHHLAPVPTEEKKKKRMDEQQLKIKEPRLWKIQDDHLAFPSSLMDLTFI